MSDSYCKRLNNSSWQGKNEAEIHELRQALGRRSNRAEDLNLAQSEIQRYQRITKDNEEEIQKLKDAEVSHYLLP
jgi:hypothetical protein